MPYLKIQTNVPVDEDTRRNLLTRASQTVSGLLGKSERYVMVTVQPAQDMVFAGSDAPLAYLELKSIGLPESATADVSKGLCELMQSELGIPPDRVYIEFADAPRKMWGWNGGTF